MDDFQGPRKKVLQWLTLMSFVLPLHAGQIHDSETGSPATIHSEAKLVVVDVVVTDKNHNRIHNLQQHDFLVTDGSEKQTVLSLEEHTAQQATQTADTAPLPPGTFTNRLPPPRSSAMNIILIDVLNTPMKDQSYLRDQIATYLGTVPPGIDLAVFALNSRLVMLQGFTSDPRILKHALDSRLPARSVLLSSAAEDNSTPVTITDRIRDAGLATLIPLKTQAAMQSGEDRSNAAQTQSRVKVTLDGLNTLARFLADFPGRKNLIWFSGSFPVNVMPRVPLKYRDNPNYDAFASYTSSEREYRETVNLFMHSQIAVYPIDSRGLLVSSAISLQNSGNGTSDPRQFGENESNFSSGLLDEHGTMERMATDTGGRAFINTNGFVQAIHAAVDDGASYYTLTYKPTNLKWHGEFRPIGVRLAQHGYSLSYRHGYYADDPNSHTSAFTTPPADSGTQIHGRLDDSDLVRAMAHGVPGATQVLYHLSVLSHTETGDGTTTAHPHQALRTFQLNYQLDPHSVVLLQGSDKKYRGFFEFTSCAYTADGKVAATRSNQMQLTLTPEQYAIFMDRGIPFQQQLSIPAKGEYSIGTGILDINSRRVGSLEVPFERLKDLPPLPIELQKGPALKSRPLQ